jgi:hypothetical protein
LNFSGKGELEFGAANTNKSSENRKKKETKGTHLDSRDNHTAEKYCTQQVLSSAENTMFDSPTA